MMQNPMLYAALLLTFIILSAYFLHKYLTERRLKREALIWLSQEKTEANKNYTELYKENEWLAKELEKLKVKNI